MAVHLELGERIAKLAHGRARRVVHQHLLGPRIWCQVIDDRDPLVEEVTAACLQIAAHPIAREPLPFQAGDELASDGMQVAQEVRERLAGRLLHREHLQALVSDEQVIERLTSVKGLGRWTAEMFLMFRLHRPDVLPVGDLGIVNAVQRLYRLRKRPDGKRLMKLGEAWKPYRSVA